MDVGKLGRTRRITAEYDAYGQVIITEDGGKFSLRSRGSSDAVSTSILGADEVRSMHSSNGRAPGRSNDDRLSPTPVTHTDWVERPVTPQTTGSSSHYRRRAHSVEDEVASAGPVAPGGTMSTTSSSLLRRIGGRAQHRRADSESSDSDSTTRYSDFSRRHAKRAGGQRRQNRRRKKKKHKGRSIDKHSADRSGLRRYSASDINDVDGPDNEYWRELVAEQRRRSSLERPRRGRRRSASSSPHRRRHTTDNRLSAHPPRANGTSPPPSVATGSGNGSVHHSVRRQLSASSSKSGEHGCCGSAVAPAVVFVVVGCLLIIVGVIRIFICFWHEFGSSVWAGTLLLVFGGLRAILAGEYHKHFKVLLYILVGLLTSVGVLVACAFSLQVLVPTLSQVTAGINDTLDARVLVAVDFSKYADNKTVTGVESVTWPSVVLDACSLLLLTVALYSQTATVIALDRYWHYNYTSTGECRYCGPPRLCNPIDQMSVGQATVLVGLVEITMLEYVPDLDADSPHAWSVVWSGALLIVAGFAGLCYGKRPDSMAAGVVSVVLMSCALLGCTVAVVLTTLSIVKDADRLRVSVASLHNDSQSSPYSLVNLVALVVIQAIADGISAVGVLFVASNLFRQVKRLCLSTATIIDNNNHQNMSISSRTSGSRPQVIVAATSL